jgi:hypothetical protein
MPTSKTQLRKMKIAVFWDVWQVAAGILENTLPPPSTLKFVAARSSETQIPITRLQGVTSEKKEIFCHSPQNIKCRNRQDDDLTVTCNQTKKGSTISQP